MDALNSTETDKSQKIITICDGMSWTGKADKTVTFKYDGSADVSTQEITDLADGIYYVYCSKKPGTVKSVQGSLISLPYFDGTDWKYNYETVNLASKINVSGITVTKTVADSNVGTQKNADYTLTASTAGSTTNKIAKYAIVDPELMKTVPPKFTAYQGFDALFHSLEGYISNKHNIMGDMIQRAAIENIGHYLARAVKDGNDIEAREHVAYANTMSGYSMVVTSCISEHSMEHAMSAYHPELPHGAGLIMLSKEYFTFWINKHVCDERFIDMAHFLGMKDASKPEDFITALLELQKACGVDDLKMSDYGIKKEEAMTLAKNARATMMRLFVRDPQETTDEEIAGIYERAYR